MTSVSDDVKKFIERSKETNSIVSFIKQEIPGAAIVLDTQIETFHKDVQLVEKGIMSYSDMRILYG